MATTCPYCNIEVRESDIEAEDGCCPECGAQIIGVRSLLDDPDTADYQDYEEDGSDDVFSDLDDDEDDGNDFSRRDLDDDDIFGDDELGDSFDEELGEDFDDEMFDEEMDDEDFDAGDEEFDDK